MQGDERWKHFHPANFREQDKFFLWPYSGWGILRLLMDGGGGQKGTRSLKSVPLILQLAQLYLT